jgi:alpha-mannosidase
MVERGLTAEGGPHEVGMPTFPARRFVSAGGLTVAHEGLMEYELVDDGGTLALTLLRAVGLLSGTHLATRPQPAGPPVPVEGAQLQGTVVRRYAVAVGEVDPWALADHAFVPLEVASATGLGTMPPVGSALTVDGAEVSALRRVPGGLELRVFNPTPAEVRVSVPGHSGWLVDLRGRPLEPFTESFSLRPWGIATADLVLGTVEPPLTG